METKRSTHRSGKSSINTSLDQSTMSVTKKDIGHITPSERFEMERINNENKRLYSKILDIDNQL